MAGISSKAVGKLDSKSKYNGIELDEDLGLNAYEAFYRTLDPSIGKWWQIDPKIEGQEFESPYSSMANNPILKSDPLGDEPCCKELWKDIKDAVKETAASAYNGAVSVARVVNQVNPIASAVEVITGKSSASDFAESKPRTQAVADLGVNTVMMFGGEIAAIANGVKLNASTVGIQEKSASLIEQNAAQGAAFEKSGMLALEANGNTNIVSQVTIKANNGAKTRIDAASIDATGKIALTEFKSSATAPLTSGQKKAFPSITSGGGVVMGKGKPGFPGGTNIPPTKIDIIRPTNKN